MRAGQSFSAFDAQACGEGIPYTTGAWQMLALPCVTLANPATPASVFGGSPTLANLDADDYNVSNGWAIYRREVSTTPSSYVKLDKNNPLTAGSGYWLKSLSAAANGKLTAAGTRPIAPDTTAAQGCLTGNVCKAVTVTTVNGQNRYNLVGNPFAYPVDWSKVRIRINGSSTTYTPSQAANLATGDDAAGNVNPPVLSKQIWIWNGASYDTYDDTAQPGNLRYFQSFWVNVLPAADGQTIELLIPKLPSTISRANPAGSAPALPWYLAWLDLIAPPARAADFATTQAKAPAVVNWQVRLKLDNHATGWHDHTNLLGQWQAAEPGYDARDLTEMAPFATPYLTLVFPHPEWGPKAGDYATDFRPALGKRLQDWTFEVRADPVGGVVFLSWEGDAKILKRSRLIDVQTGKTIQPAAGKWAKKGYPITLKSPVQRYVWRYLGK